MIKLIILALGAVPILGLSIKSGDGKNVISSENKLNEQLWQKFKVGTFSYEMLIFLNKQQDCFVRND